MQARSQEFDKLLPELRIQFDEAWRVRKLAIIPGDELLRSVMKEYGPTYKKQRDAKQIAALMDQAEILREVVNLLSEIAPKR
jgi:hypothetical protein